MHKTTLLVAALLAATAFQANAQTYSTDALDDRWEISGSYFRPDISLGARADLTGSNGEEVVNVSERARATSGVDGARFEATFRMTPRQRLIGAWYGVGRDRSFAVSEQGVYTPPDSVDGIDPIEYQADGTARVRADFELYRLSCIV